MSLRRGRGLFGVLFVVFSLIGLPAGSAWAHDGGVMTAEEHAQEDSVSIDPVEEAQQTENTDRASSGQRSKAARAAALTGDEHLKGQWGPVQDWPVVAVHVALLTNGKVLAFDSVGDNASEHYTVHDRTRATVWDPATNTFQNAEVTTGYNIFCAGLGHLLDGTVFTAGGNKNAALDGIKQTHTFNQVSGAWVLGPDMARERWYPTVTPLQGGEMLITDGTSSSSDAPEIRATNGTLRSLTGAAVNLPLYPWLDVAPNGRVFYSGPDNQLRSLNTSGSGSWTVHGARDGVNRDYGSHALYDVGKMLISGGAIPATKSSRVVDFNNATPTVSNTADMAFPRRQHNLTVLADGSVLATGGLSSNQSLVDLNNPVYAAELWNPATGTWKTLASESAIREYHSTALLLADGRVLSGGGGICGACESQGYMAKNAQVFTPPYLYKKDGSGELAPRPSISFAPDAVAYGASFEIQTPQAANISKVALMRVASVTHSVNMEQRYIPLTYTKQSGKLTATAPANANIAPQGVYHVVILDADGVPSVGRNVSVLSTANQPPSVDVSAPSAGATYVAPASYTFSANATDSDGTIAKVEFFRGATLVGTDTSSPFSVSETGVAAGSYALTAKATDNGGATRTSAAVNITVNANVAPTVSVTSPSAGATYVAPASYTFSANAADSDGTVSKVEFFRGSTLVGTDTSSPFTISESGVAAGSYALTAKATDNGGAVTTSGAVNITVNAPNVAPTVSVTSPSAGATFTAPASYTFSANAADSDGTVSKVEFFRGSTLVGTDTSSPFTISESGVAAGSYALTAKATDNGGAVTTSGAVNITVNPPAPTGPIAAYAFDEGSGSTVTDKTGNGHNGTMNGASWVSGRNGKALSFGASNHYVTIPDANALDLTSQMTIEGWFQLRSLQQWQTIILKEAPGDLAYGMYATSGSTTRPNAWIGGQGTYPAGNSATGQWTHMAMTLEGGTLKTYVNGVLATTETGIANAAVTSGALRIGGNSIWPFEWLDGMVDDVRIYNRAITAAEVITDRDTPVSPPPAVDAPVLQLDFDEASGSTATDTSGKAHHGTIAGATRTASGYRGGALDFDGSPGDVVTVPDHNDLDLTTSLTLEARIRPRTAKAWMTVMFKEQPGNLSYGMYATSGSTRNANGWIGDAGVYNGSPTALNTWSHLAYTLSPDGTGRLYVNGALVATAPGMGAAVVSNGKLTIGGNSVWDFEGFDGLIDEVRVWPRTLTSAEVASNAASGGGSARMATSLSKVTVNGSSTAAPAAEAPGTKPAAASLAARKAAVRKALAKKKAAAKKVRRAPACRRPGSKPKNKKLRKLAVCRNERAHKPRHR